MVTEGITVQEKGWMSPRGEAASKEKFILVVTGVIVIPTRDLIPHPRLGILHHSIEAVPTFLLWDLTETVQIQYLRGGWYWPVLYLEQDEQPC